MILFVMTTEIGSEAVCDYDEIDGDADCDDQEIGCDYDEIGGEAVCDDEISGDADCDDDEFGNDAALRMKRFAFGVSGPCKAADAFVEN